MIIGIIITNDKRGREAFFLERSYVYDIEAAATLLRGFPHWSLRTEDWGYFQRGYEEVKSGEIMRWEQYNVYHDSRFVSIVSSTFYIVGSMIEIIRYCCSKWSFWLWVTFS